MMFLVLLYTTNVKNVAVYVFGNILAVVVQCY